MAYEFAKGKIEVSGTMTVHWNDAKMLHQMIAAQEHMAKMHEALMSIGAKFDGQDGYDLSQPKIQVLIDGIPWSLPAEFNNRSVRDIFGGGPHSVFNSLRPRDADGWEFREFIGTQKGCSWSGYKIWENAPPIPGAYPTIVEASCEEFDL